MIAGRLTPAKVVQERRRLEESVRQAYEELRVLQHRCKHPNVTKEHGSSTGNWCKADDCYWIEYECIDCGKKWTEDQ
jgi:hypothetical protein